MFLTGFPTKWKGAEKQLQANAWRKGKACFRNKGKSEKIFFHLSYPGKMLRLMLSSKDTKVSVR